MSVWMLIIAVFASDGSTAVQVLNAPSPAKNTEEVCRASGETLAQNLYKQFGKEIVVVWGCKQITKQEFDRALPPPI